MKKNERRNRFAAKAPSDPGGDSIAALLERHSEPNAASDQGAGARWSSLRNLNDHDWVFGLLLVLAALMVYSPALNGKFLWDDDSWTSRISNLLQGIRGLGAMWFDPTAMQQYYPVTGTTFWIDHQLWGVWTLPYHVENVLLHATSGLLFWRLLRRLRVEGARLASAIFVLHPLMVESVAWITERKNMLSLPLYLGALLAYGRFTRFWFPENEPDVSAVEGPPRRRWGAYGSALVLFLGALLAKTTAFSLPAVILLICWWKRGSIRWRADVLPTLPFFALAMGCSALTSWLERHHVGALGADWNHSFPERCLIAGRALWFYVGKLLWPVNLCFDYPQWHLNAGSPGQWLYPAAVIGVLLGLWLARGRIGRGPIAAALFFVGSLFPLLGFMNVYFMRFSFVCDHWVYLPSLGLIALGAALAVRMGERLQAPGIFFVGIVAGLCGLALLTWRQTKMYTGPETLWRTTIAKNPNSWLAHENLAGLYFQNGQMDEAIAQFQRSLEIQPRNEFAHNSLGIVFVRLGRVDEAIVQFQEAVDTEPNEVDAHNNLATLLLQKGRVDEAMVHFRKMLEIEPNNAYASGQLGRALLQKGQVDEAIAYLSKSVGSKPGDPNIQADLGNALLIKGQVDEAIVHYRASLKIQPNNPGAQANLGNALLKKRQLTEAVAHYRKALEFIPDNTNLLNLLARILAASPDPSIQNGTEAIALAQRADRLSGEKNPEIIATLAAADAAAGQFSEAVKNAQRAMELATAQNDMALVKILQTQIGLYRANLPFRDPSLTNAPPAQERSK